MFIDTTMTPKVDELLRGMIVQSGNDASVALAEGVGGSLDVFVAMMNRQAQAWGLKNTQFRNVTGLTEPGHYAAARDVATIAAKIITDFPDFYTLYSIRQFTYNKIKQDNRNLLLGRDPTVDGMKTGFTETAGYCLVASAVRDLPNGKRRLVSVVLGTASREARAAESQKLLNWGFQAWDAVRLFEAGAPVLTVPVWKAKVAEVPLGAPGAMFVSVPKGEGDKLKTQVERTDPLVAPLTQGQQVGRSRSRPAPARRWRRCRWWCCSRWSWPASSAAPGTRCGCGSSKLQRPSAWNAAMTTPLPDTPCYLNGEYTRVCDAKVTVLDRGFIFGDGIYEVVPVYGRRLFRFDEHMARLQRGLAKVRIANPHDREAWLERCRHLVQALAAQTGAEDQLVYIQVTRGVAPRDHVMPRGHRADGLHDGHADEAADAPSSATTAWPASRRATSAGSAATSRASRCWATCWRGRSRPTTARWRRSCSATAG